ncbi:MAG: hypothetical protein JNK97_03560 [Zoogloea sp.]|nr:hypothetical protein [Zoogloea sp.]
MKNHLTTLNKMICTGLLDDANITYNANFFEEANVNPLATVRLLTIDHAHEEAISPEDCATITGLPSTLSWSTSEAPDVSSEDLERALGRMTLAWLASVRNTLAEAAGLQGREDLVTAAMGKASIAPSPVRRAAERRAA